MFESDEPHMSRRYTTMVVAALALVALSCVAFLVPVPYVTLRPGPVFNTLGEFNDKPMIAFGDDVTTYPTSGTLDFTTVSVSRADTKIPLAMAVVAFFDKKNAVVPRSLVYPENQSQKESSTESAVQLSGSKESSQAAALRAAGYEVTEHPGVASVVKDGPSVGKLVAGDIVLSVDGEKTRGAESVATLIRKHKPGETTRLTVRREGKEQAVQIETIADPKDNTIARIGIGIGQKFEFPIKIINNVGNEIGGPSAGTMFALAIYDKLTPGKLANGKHIAGTGEIDGAGVVGSIGGVRQKMAGAAADDTQIFLVPDANCEEAADGDDFGMTLVRIKTLDNAIDSLEALADNPKANVPTCN